MQYAPYIPHWRMCFYYPVCKGEWNHVEVSKTYHEMATLGSTTHELCYLPGLGGAVAHVRVVGFAFVGGVKLLRC